jgi:tetratricopeptide (TPR) repeat protein
MHRKRHASRGPVSGAPEKLPTQPQAASRLFPIFISNRLLGWLALGNVFVLTFLLCCHKIYEADIGFHLRAGQWILEHGRWPETDPFTYTVSDHAYIDAHWLYQLALVALYRLGGAAALVLAHAILIVAAFGLAALVSWQSLRSPLALAGLLLLGILASELRFLLRPEVLTWLFLSLVVLVLERHARGKTGPLWALPLIHLIWVNIEGLFVLGWVVIGCYVLGDLLRERRLDRRLAAWGIASLLATLVNPYFLRGVLFPLTLLTRLDKQNVFSQSISELASPWQAGLALPWSAWAYYVMAVMLLAGLALTWRKRHPREFLLALVFFGLSVQAIRNIPLFVLVGMPILAGCLQDAAQLFANFSRRNKKSRTALPSRRTVWLPLAELIVLLVALGLSLRITTNAYYIAARRPNRFGFTFSAEDLPVKAAAFMRANGLNGKIFNHLNDGGYLMWQLPQPVFIDGRLEVIGEDFYSEYQKASQKDGLLPVLEKYGAEVVVFPYQAAVSWVQQLRRAAQWRLVYYDDLSVVYARTDIYPQLAEAGFPAVSPNGLPAPVPADVRDGLLHAPRVGGVEPWLQGFWQTPPLPRESINYGIFYYYLDKLDIAEAYLLDALRASRGEYIEVYLNLGSVYTNAKQNDLAAFCYQVALAEKEIPLARERLERLRAP